MNKSYNAALIYLILGLTGGLFYREYSKEFNFEGFTQLSVVHTHLLVLGMLFFLIVIALEKTLTLSKSRWFTPFFWCYNIGLIITAGMMVTHGIMAFHDYESSGMTAGISGLGHIAITAGLLFFFVAIRQRISVEKTTTAK